MFTTTYNAPNLYAPTIGAGDGVYHHQINIPAKRLRDSSMASTSGSLCFLGEDLTVQLTQHQSEVDRLISSHMEKVRAGIEERTRKETIRILQAIQEGVARKLTEKDEQIEKIGKMNWALQERVKSISLENQIWRDLAQSNEATANELRSNIQQVLLQSNNNQNRVISETDDAESCCGSSSHKLEDEEEDDESQRWRKVARTSSGSAAEDEKRKRWCRKCGSAESSVLLLPCRHLCLCSACAPAVDSCPVCNSVKNASVHVNLS